MKRLVLLMSFIGISLNIQAIGMLGGPKQITCIDGNVLWVHSGTNFDKICEVQGHHGWNDDQVM